MSNASSVSGHFVGVESVERRLRFELLYAKHAPAVKAYALRRADASTADDVVAEVFLVCWRRFDEIPADPLPWLLGVAKRVLSTQRRGERRRGALRERLTETAIDSSSAPLGFGDRALADVADGALAAALVRLSDADRELLLLIAWDGLSPAQAATVLGVKPVTVRVRLLRARRRLTQALSREGSDLAPCSSLSMEAPS
jgi:RNA polymerase sigma-70 factor (ECF subfamily)